MAASLHPGLMPSLRDLVRGLTLIFWVMPLALLACVQGAVTDWLRPFGPFPPVITTGLLLLALHFISRFQPQERVWQHTLDRAKILAIVNIGFVPFLYWFRRVPDEPTFYWAVALLSIFGLVFLCNLNLVLQRLVAMLPDEILRSDVRFLTRLNLGLTIFVMIALGVYYVSAQLAENRPSPNIFIAVAQAFTEARRWMLLLLVLLPVAVTMSLLWKTKETVMKSVFSQPAPAPVETPSNY